MLIIARKPQESFIIGDDIEVIILDIQNDKIRIGINAPKHIQILRKELYDTQKANQEAVASLDKDSLRAIKQEIEKQKKKT